MKTTADSARSSAAADRLRECKEHILEVWEERVRDRLQAAKMESHSALRDSLPDFLDDLEEALRTSIRQVRTDLVRVAKKHGSERANASEYTIEEALAEYNILRKVIFEVLERDSPLSPRERDVIYEAINFGLAKAGAEYSRRQVEKETAVKRQVEEKEALLRAVIDQMPAAVWVAEPSGELYVGNLKSRTIMKQPGSPAENVKQYGDYVGFHPDGRRLQAQDWPLARSIQKGERVINELIRVENPEGGSSFLRMFSAPIMNALGEITSAVAIGVDETEIVQARAKVTESEEWLQLALEASNVGIFDHDLASGYVNWSREHALIFGGDPSKKTVPFDWIRERIHIDDRPLFQSKFDQALSGLSDFVCDFRVVHPDGAIRWVHCLSRVLVGSGGKPSRMLGAVTDVTQSKLAQEALVRSADQLKLIADAQPTLISYVDKNYVYRVANQTYLDWFHQVPSKIVGKTMEEVLGARAFQELKPHLDRALAGQRVQFEAEIHYRDGGDRFISGTYVPDLDRSRGVQGVFVSVSDITAIREAQKLLEQSKEEYVTLAELLPLVIFSTDAEGNNTYVNQAWRDYLGLSGGRELGWSWIQAIHPDDQDRALESWRQAVVKKEPYEIDYRLRRAWDGQYRWVRTRARPLTDPQGEVNKWIGVSIDIEAERRRETVLQEQARQFREDAETQSLATEDKKRLIESLEGEKRIREQFVNALTHDLRTPLASIKMAAQISNRSSEKPLVQSMTGRIIENVNRADRMIQDLLDANRVKAGEGLVPDIQQIDLEQVVRQTLEDLTTIYGDRFVLKSESPLRAFLCPFGMRRIVENLCTNGIKYGEPHTPVTVRLETQGHEVRISVHNRGKPLSETELNGLFQYFHRTKTAIESGKTGWGIGLTIVKGVAEAHCGGVEVRSEPDYGTQFTVTVLRDAREHCVNKNDVKTTDQ